MIAKRGDKYVILSKKGKQLGEYGSKEEATKRLKQIEYFKMKAKKKQYKKGGKLMKYLKGGQVKLDANNDGKISGEDFMMLRKKQ